MLNIALREGDYFMLGDNVKIIFKQKAGKDQIYVGIEAPKDLKVLRCELYEDEVAQKAASGDAKSKELSTQLQKQADARREEYRRRRSSRREHDRRIAGGEIQKPQGWEDRPEREIIPELVQSSK